LYRWLGKPVEPLLRIYVSRHEGARYRRAGARVCQKIEKLGYRSHAMPGAQRTAIGITGNKGEVEQGTLEEMPGVQEVIKVSKPYKLVSRDLKEDNTVIRFRRNRGHDWRAWAGDRRGTVRHREPRTGLCRGRARASRRSAVLSRRRLQAAHFSLLFSGMGEEGLKIMARFASSMA
jgi:3-deoxy-7-phosphoheptulonate synthase